MERSFLLSARRRRSFGCRTRAESRSRRPISTSHGRTIVIDFRSFCRTVSDFCSGRGAPSRKTPGSMWRRSTRARPSSSSDRTRWVSTRPRDTSSPCSRETSSPIRSTEGPRRSTAIRSGSAKGFSAATLRDSRLSRFPEIRSRTPRLPRRAGSSPGSTVWAGVSVQSATPATTAPRGSRVTKRGLRWRFGRSRRRPRISGSPTRREEPGRA